MTPSHAPDLGLDPARYHMEPLEAYVRGAGVLRPATRLEEHPVDFEAKDTPQGRLGRSRSQPTKEAGPGSGPEVALREARARGLRVHRFKRTHLPRVERVLGLLRGLWPSRLLDVGSGRGAFLWPLLEAFPALQVTSLERSALRARQLAQVRQGGIERLSVLGADVCAAPLADDSCEGVTALEVLEHLRDPGAAARELVRVARRFVIASVPSKPDDNPEHLRVFSVSDLEQLFLGAGAARLQVQHVLNHRIALVTP